MHVRIEQNNPFPVSSIISIFNRSLRVVVQELMKKYKCIQLKSNPIDSEQKDHPEDRQTLQPDTLSSSNLRYIEPKFIIQ